MRNKYFNIVVKKILKYKGSVLEISRIRKIIRNIIDDEYTDSKLYKMLYYLKNRGYLYPLKKDIYYVKDPDYDVTDEYLLDTYYWNIVKKHCKEYLYSDWYIGGLKALELGNNSYQVPEELLIVNKNKQSNEIIMFDKKIIYKNYNNDKNKVFQRFKKFTNKIHIKNNVFNIANTELAILESLYNINDLLEGYIIEYIKKILRSKSKSLDFSIWEKIIKMNKHHSSINRLYKISLSVDPDLSENLKKIIKKYSYFINV